MSEQNLARQFNTDVDQLLENGQVEARLATGEYHAMLKLAQALATHETRAQSRVEQSLRHRLLKQVGNWDEQNQPKKGLFPMQTVPPSARRFPRLALATLILLAIFIVITFTIPPVRAVAQDIIRSIGNYIFTDKPTDAEEYVATLTSGTPTPTIDPDWVCTDCAKPRVSGRLTVAQASQTAGFPVYEPTYIPEGYQLSSRDVLTTSASTTVSADYRIELDPPLHNGQQMAGIIAIGQTLVLDGAQPWEKGVGDVPVVEVTVRGQPGVWLEQVPTYPFQNDKGEWEYACWNQLIWAEAGYNFMLQTNMPADLLPLEEMLRIAESLIS